MHEAAYRYVARAVRRLGPFRSVVEFGSRNVNGSVRRLFGEVSYTGVDRCYGPGVDVVGDAACWTSEVPVDCVVCCEVFEHTPLWRHLVTSAGRALAPGGVLIVTCAGPGREPHSAFDGGPLAEGEFYGNVGSGELRVALVTAGFVDVEVEQVGDDVRATARKEVTDVG